MRRRKSEHFFVCRLSERKIKKEECIYFMKRRIIAFALGIACLLASVASAQTVSLTENSRTVTVTEKADGAAEGMLLVVKADSDVSDNDNVFAMKKAKAADGALTFTFDMRDERNGSPTDGKYDLYIGTDKGTTLTGSMYYASVQSRADLMTAVKAAADKSALKAVIENDEHQNAIAAIGCGTELYEKGDKETICSFIMPELKKETDLTEKKFAEIFNTATAASMLSKCAESETGTYLSIVNLSFEGVNYSDITESALVKWINESVYNARPYESVDSLRTIYTEANMLYKIASSRVGSIGKTISGYAKALDIEEDEVYKKYSSSAKKDTADEKLVALLKKQGTVNKKQFLNLLGDALSSNGGSSGGSSGGTSGGSSSGGSSGSSGASSTTSSVAGITTSTPSASTQTSASTFNDMKDAAWAENAVNKLAEKKLVAGYEDGSFRPNDLLTREAFVKMLVAASGIYDETAECDFDDVPKDAWYYKYVASAVKKGIVSGISDTEFGTGRNITRQDMAALAYKAFGAPDKKRDSVAFADGDDISAYASKAVNALYEGEIISGMGDNKFEPFGTATRAQGAVVIYNLYF